MSKVKQKEQGKPKADFKPDWPWSPLTAVIYTIFLYLSQYLAAFVLIVYPIARHWDRAQTVYWLNHSIVAQFIFVLLAEGLTVWLLWLFLKKYKVSFRQLGWNRLPSWKDLGLALLVLVVYFIALTVALDVISALIPALNTSQKQQVGFSHASGFWSLTMTYISLAILPPLVEETVFRGFLYGSLRKTLSVLQAVLTTGVLFGVAHLQLFSGAPPLWTAAIDVFILSFGLIYLRVKTGSLWASAMLHCLKNTVAFLVLFVFTLNI